MGSHNVYSIHQKREVKSKHVMNSQPHQSIDSHVFPQVIDLGHWAGPVCGDKYDFNVFIGLVQFTLCSFCTQASLNGEFNCQWWLG